jgi:putative ABC transport system permease protein
MSPHRLALRTLLLGSSRSVLAIVLIAASLCVLDLYAGHVASVRARMEYQAVIGERLGHLAILPALPSGAGGGQRMFDAAQARRVQRLLSATHGVALAVPQMSVSGMASTGQRSTLFHGEGVSAAPDSGAAVAAQLPGKLHPGIRNGIAVSSGQARSLGLRAGSEVTLTATSPNNTTAPVDAEVVNVYSTAGQPEGARKPLLMPFDMAQTLQGTELTERFVIYLNEPAKMDQVRTHIATALRAAGIPVQVKAWYEQSVVHARPQGFSDLAFDSVAGMVFAVIAATIAATISMNALERRREIGILRALGMRSSSVFLMLVMEGLWMGLIGVAASLLSSALIAWIVNRAALSYTASHAASSAPMLVELDFNRISMAVVAAMAVALLAALVPAFKAARVAIAPALAS